MKNNCSNTWLLALLGCLLVGIVTMTPMDTRAGRKRGSVSARLPSGSATAGMSYYQILYKWGVITGLASRDLNGIALNGKYLDGHYITQVSLNGVIVKNRTIDSLRLKGTHFVAKKAGRHFKKGRAHRDMVFLSTLDDGRELKLRVDEIEKSRNREDRDTIHYKVSYETVDGWIPLCGVNDDGEPIGAIPLKGRWDYSRGTETGGSKIEDEHAFTFACEGYVLHKCVEAGYKPWGSITVCEKTRKRRMKCKEVSLAAQHQACTRMMRADFCGDGTPYTEDDIVVAMYDRYGIRIDTEDWETEAEWDEDGAICLQGERIDGLTPECGDYLFDEECGDPSHFADGTLLISELPPPE
ncbi:MAG: hypothetical protein GY847_15025 [Proteobacteria bacterium]|nr:hypothetical protein [Pseudomonadota bacterium]